MHASYVLSQFPAGNTFNGPVQYKETDYSVLTARLNSHSVFSSSLADHVYIEAYSLTVHNGGQDYGGH